MKRILFVLLIGFIVTPTIFTVLAQTDTIKRYTGKNIEWRLYDKVDYQGGTKGYSSFLNVSADADGKIYVSNAGVTYNVLVFDAKTGKKLSTIADSSGTIQKIFDAVPAADGNIWVADYKSMVYLLDSSGKILLKVPFKSSPGMSDRQPWNIAVGPDGNLYVLYTGSALLMQVFTPKGEFVRTIVSGTGNLGGIDDFAFGPDGSLFVGNAVGIARVIEDGTKLTLQPIAEDFIKEFDGGTIAGLAVDHDGNIYFNTEVKGLVKLDAEGKLIGQYGKGQKKVDWGNEFGPDELSFTVRLAFAPDGSLIISDTNNWYSQLIKINMQD